MTHTGSSPKSPVPAHAGREPQDPFDTAAHARFLPSMGPPTPAWLRQSASLSQQTRETDGLNKAFFISVASDEQLVELLGFGEAPEAPATYRSTASSLPTEVQRSLCPAAFVAQRHTGVSKVWGASQSHGSGASPGESTPLYGSERSPKSPVPQHSSPFQLPCSRHARQPSGCRLSGDREKANFVSSPMATRLSCTTANAPSGTLCAAKKSPTDSSGDSHDASGSPPTNLAIAFLRGVHTDRRSSSPVTAIAQRIVTPKLLSTPPPDAEKASKAATLLQKTEEAKLHEEAPARLPSSRGSSFSRRSPPLSRAEALACAFRRGVGAHITEGPASRETQGSGRRQQHPVDMPLITIASRRSEDLRSARSFEVPPEDSTRTPPVHRASMMYSRDMQRGRTGAE